ncbi:MAG: BatA and WFA domain-containing protein, partial [Pirellulaceae bacterium]
MNLLNTLTPWQWAILAGVPPAILLLYFLKLKRQPREVPSTYLWSRTIEDLHVNSIWQRLRQSLLLFLQLLLVFLAILACARPGWRGLELPGDRFVFLVDASASMAATDVSPTRLDEAKRLTLEKIELMESGDVAMVISFSDEARIEQSFTNNRSLLRQKVNRIRQTNRRSDLVEALRAAAGLANPGRTSERPSDTPGGIAVNDIQVADELPATMYIYSDGGVPSVSNFSLGHLTPVFIPIGSPAPENVGIVAFTADRNPEKPGETQAFARIQNGGAEDVTVEISLFLNEILADASEVTVPAAAETGVEFDLEAVEDGVLRLDIARADHLPLDNRAHVALGVPRPARVLLVTNGDSDALRLALTTEQATKVAEISFAEPSVLKTKQHQDQALTGSYDLIIYDQCQPETMPQANTLFLGAVPPLPGWSGGEASPAPAIFDIDRSHPLTQLVEMGNVLLAEARPLKAPPGA